MRINYIVIMILFNIFASPTIYAAVSIQQWFTESGANVLWINNPNLPIVDIEISFDAGSARDGNKHGLAQLTAQLLTTAAGKFSTDQMAQQFEQLGAEFQTRVEQDMSLFSLRSLSNENTLNSAIELMNLQLTQPTFYPQDFQRLKNQQLTQCVEQQQSPAELAKVAFNQAIFGLHPYAFPIIGFKNTVSELTVAQTQIFYQQYYVAKNATIAIVGNIDRPFAEKIATQLLKGLPSGNKAQNVVPVNLPIKSQLINISFPSTQTHIWLGLPAVSRMDKDYVPLYVANYILGGNPLVSRLFSLIREQNGLVYSIHSQLMPFAQSGSFNIQLQTKNNQAKKALELVNQAINEWVNYGVNENELIAAKKNITGGFVLRYDTNRKWVHYLTTIGFYSLPLDYLQRFPEQVELITLDQIREVLKRRIQPQLLQIIKVGGDE